MSHSGRRTTVCHMFCRMTKKTKKKQTKLKQKQRRIYLTFAFSKRHVTVKRNIKKYDNALRHVTAFRPISKAAHSYSYDNSICLLLRWPRIAVSVKHRSDVRPSVCLSICPSGLFVSHVRHILNILILKNQMNFGSCPEHILNIAYIANVPTSQQYITFGDATKFLTTPVLSLSLTRRTKVRVQVANMSCIGNKVRRYNGTVPVPWVGHFKS